MDQHSANKSIQSGQICGFFDQNVFTLGYVLSFANNRCSIFTSSGETIAIPPDRLVLSTKSVFLNEKPLTKLSGFRTEMDSWSKQFKLEQIRQTMLQNETDCTLEEIANLENLPAKDACRFALFEQLRMHPSRFRSRKGIYHANSDEEMQAYLAEEEEKELRRRELNACPLLARKGLPCLFADKLIALAESVAYPQDDADRTDLTSLDCWTIDAENTRDLDDAISLTETATGWQFGVHISDVSCLVQPDSELDREAFRRTSSIYLPDRDVHMLPEAISCRRSSLLRNESRPALSLLCSLDQASHLTDCKIMLSTIQVSRRFSYDEFGLYLSGDEADDKDTANLILTLKAMVDKHLQGRKKNGAIWLEDESLSPARLIIAECMVMYNALLTEFAVKNGIPLFFRHLDEGKNEPTGVKSQTDFLPPSILSTNPLPHSAMGLKAYAQLTSPLRRYSDLVNQRQIAAFLKGDKLPYDIKSLEDKLEHLSVTRQRIRQATLQAEREAVSK